MSSIHFFKHRNARFKSQFFLVYLSLSCFLLVNMATDEVDNLYKLY